MCADALRTRERALSAGREAFAARGFDASYHEIARLAGVGVGTAFRRYPDREALLEAVLLDILDDLTRRAQAAATGDDPGASFVAFLVGLPRDVYRHAGLSGRLEGRGGERVAAARDRLLCAVRRMHRRVRKHGLRRDIGWEDVLFLTQFAGADGCGLYLAEASDLLRERAISVIIDRLRARPDKMPQTSAVGVLRHRRST